MNALIQEELDRESVPVELDSALGDEIERGVGAESEHLPAARTYRRLGFAILVSGIVLLANIFLVVHGAG